MLTYHCYAAILLALANALPQGGSGGLGLTSSTDLPGEVISGEATYYDEWASPAVSCNPVKCPDDGLCAAIPAKYMGDKDGTKESCGKCVKVVYEDKAIVLRVMDTCPGCGETKLDFAIPAFEALIGDKGKGRVPVKWAFVDCNGAGDKKDDKEDKKDKNGDHDKSKGDTNEKKDDQKGDKKDDQKDEKKEDKNDDQKVDKKDENSDIKSDNKFDNAPKVSDNKEVPSESKSTEVSKSKPDNDDEVQRGEVKKNKKSKKKKSKKASKKSRKEKRKKRKAAKKKLRKMKRKANKRKRKYDDDDESEKKHHKRRERKNRRRCKKRCRKEKRERVEEEKPKEETNNNNENSDEVKE